jgi:hypothetical protein
MARNKQLSWVKRKTKYFCKWGWTQHRVICPNDKINIVVPAKHNVIPGTNASVQFDSFEKSG